MNHLLQQVLQVSIIGLVLGGFSYIIGAFLVRIIRISDSSTLFNIFFRLILGVSLIVILYASIITRLNSVMIGLALVLSGVVWQMRQFNSGATNQLSEPSILSRKSHSRDSAVSMFAIVLTAIVIMTTARFFLLYNLHNENYDTPIPDFVYYAKLAFQLNKLGVETTSFIPATLAPPSVQPYHYFELWLNALVVKATHLPSAVSLYVVVYSLLLVIVYFGFCALFEQFGQSRIHALMLGAACLFVVGVYLPVFYHSSILNAQAPWLQLYLFVRPKLAPVYIFMLLGFLLYAQGNKKASLWAWVSIPIINIATAPAILLACGFLCIGLFVSRKNKLIYLYQLLLPILTTSLFIGSFYLINGQLHSSAKGALPIKSGVPFGSMITTPGEWHTSINLVAGTLLAFFAYYILYIVLLIVLAKFNVKQAWTKLSPYSGLIGLVSIMFISGALTSGLFIHFIDNGQFFDNAATVSFAVLFALIAAVLLQHAGSPSIYSVVLVIGLLLTINLYSTPGYVLANTHSSSGLRKLLPLASPKWPQYSVTSYSPTFLRKVAQLAPKLSSIGATIRDTADYTSRYHYNPDLFTPGVYLSTIIPREMIWLSLSHLTLDSTKAIQMAPNYRAQMRDWAENGPIQLFARQQRMQNSALTDEDIQRNFLLDQHINFICVSPTGKLPPSIQPLVQQVFVDAVSHEKFFLLNVR